MTADRSRPERVEEQDSVKVCVRIRPLGAKEKQGQTKSCIRIAASFDGLSSSKTTVSSRDGSNRGPQQLIVGKDRAFTFDNVLGVTSSQTETYRLCVAPLVQGFLDGYNATVLAYGQTGTGKTHTMAGSGFDARGREKNGELQGIIPRVIKAVFKKLQQEDGGDNQRRSDHTLRVEYVEIYNEELRDLLHPETTSKQLAIREDGEGNIVIAGVKSEPADSKEAVFRHLVVGGASRVTGSTLMNEHSSRSHAIFSLLLEQRDLTSGTRRFSKFHLVDLAGSERAKRTGAVAGRFKESVSINQGLLALGNVISALGDDKRRVGTAGGTVHVPYRDSKLTRLLQDSLGGNARTLMIACVSPASVNFEETLNTLKYANRAKNIKNKPIVNDRVASEEDRQRNELEMTRMREEIANLQTQLQQQTTATPPSRTPSRPSSSMGKHETMQTTSESWQLRPVQQRLNEIVKLLNASIQTANCSVISSKKLMPSPSRRHEKDADLTSHEGDSSQQEEETIVVQQLRHELKEAKTNLVRDEQIFEMKNEDIQKLQALLVEAKGKNEKLIQRVQELERGGQLWSKIEDPNSGGSQGKEQGNDTSSRTITASPSGRTSRSSTRSKVLTSSRGLFTRRGGTAAYDGDEDRVVMDDDDEEARIPSAPRKSRSGAIGFSRGSSRSDSSRGSLTSGRLKTSEAIEKLETTITALQEKLEELQKKNEELLDTREESTRRWALERQNYERQLSEAEHSIEALKRDNQILEDSCSMTAAAKRRTIMRLDVKWSFAQGEERGEQSRSEAARRINALEMQKMRQSVGVRESISDLSKSLLVLDERMQAESKSLEELERLKKLRVRAEKKLKGLRKQEEKADFLDSEAQQELQDLEELIVDLDSHIAFQDAELKAARNDLLAIKNRSESTDAKSPLDGLANGLVQHLGLGTADAAGAAASVMSKCLDEVARLRMRVTQQQASAEAMEQLKKMQPKVLVPSNNDENGETSDTHRDEEWQKLIVRCQKKDEYIADLEKHLVFYKSKAKQMQAQLQQLIRSSTEQQRRSDDGSSDSERERQLQRRIQQLEDANDALMQDLATAKVYLRASQSRGSVARTSGERTGAKVVRISRTIPLAPTQLEREHVHKVYDLIAPHFSHTRHHPWPQVTEFLDKLEPGALVADVGCGNGKYLRVNPSLCMIGADRSIPLMHAGAPSGSNLLGCDALKVPLRTGAFDAALSIAVLHHISTEERRVALIRELARLVRVGGEVLIVAWAFEQDGRSKRRFEKQDVMVEWKLQQKYAKEEEKEDDATGSHGKVDHEKRWVVYERYCHVYCSGELEALVALVPGLKVVSVEYTRSNCMDLINAANAINAESLKTNESGSEDDDNDETNDGSDTSRVVDKATIALRSVLEISEPTTTSYKMVVLHTAQLLKATQELKASIDCMLMESVSSICWTSRAYDTHGYVQIRCMVTGSMVWHRNGSVAHIRACFGDPHFYRMRQVYCTSFPAMYRAVFAWVDGPAGQIARCWRRHWVRLHPPPPVPSSSRAKLKGKKKPKPHLTSPVRQSRSPTRTELCGKVSASSSTSPSSTRKPRIQKAKVAKPGRRTTRNSGVKPQPDVFTAPGSSNNAPSVEETQQFQGESTIEKRCNNVKVNASAKKSSELDEHSPMKRRFSVVKRLRAKRSSVDPTTERPSSAGAEEISSDEDQIMTRSCSTSLLDVYPLKIPGTEDFISTCGREPGFADLDLDEVGEFARLAHYRARVLTGKHASVNNLDTTKVKPQWLQDLERAVRFIETHQQRNLASGKVVIEGDSVAHLSEVHTRLVLQITTLCRLYTGDYGETSFTRRLGRITRKLVEWKFTRISEVIAALNDAKFVATQEEKQRNLEFYHVHRT
ncbi:S-adenosyl-L-methionine-dependent methyltransferase [Phytophthora cactorum]|nr:S-adenosyl-L-methionine-dependent methyltransferase [Phytophthora cactorum]